MEQLKLQAVQPGQLDTLMELIEELAAYEKMSDMVVCTREDYFKAVFEEKSVCANLLLLGEEVVGYLLYFFNFSSFLGKKGLYVEDIYIRPQFRGRGLGTQVFAQLEELARERDCGRMEWTCLDWNAPSRAFYRDKLGADEMNEWILLRKVL